MCCHASSIPDNRFPVVSSYARSILKYAREHLPSFQRVRRVEFYSLPKTISGKIRRMDLREREIENAATETGFAREWRDDQFPGLRS